MADNRERFQRGSEVRGFAFPIISGREGYWPRRNADAIRRTSIMNILCTIPGERVGEPTFGCISGDTKIPLLNGKEEEIKNLVGKPCWIYGNIGGKVVPAYSIGAKSSGIKKIITVKLDSGQVVKCTENHPFMMRDGTYRKASLLKSGDRLMPLSRRISSRGYEMVYDPLSMKWVATHKMVAKEYYGGMGKGWVVHHSSFNKRNNSPATIKRRMQEIGISLGKVIGGEIEYSNHVVVEVENVGLEEEVYDLVNSTSDNFAISQGVVIHNSRLPLLVFEPNDEILHQQLIDETIRALERWDPFIEVRGVAPEVNNDTVKIFIDYVDKRSNNPAEQRLVIGLRRS